MLVQTKNIKQNDIIGIVTVDGKEIIAKFVSSDDTKITISKPLTVHMVPTPSGQAGVAFLPFSVIMDETKNREIKHVHIVDYDLASKEAAAGYLKQTSGIHVASNIGDLPDLSKFAR